MLKCVNDCNEATTQHCYFWLASSASRILQNDNFLLFLLCKDMKLTKNRSLCPLSCKALIGTKPCQH